MVRTRSGRNYGPRNATSVYRTLVAPATVASWRPPSLRATPLGSGGSMSNMRLRRAVRSGVGITAQYDRKSIYRKKRMPRKLRRRWRRFVQKVNATKDKDLGTRTVVYSSQVGVSNTTSGSDIVFSCSLYGLRALSSLVNGDLESIGGFENTGNPTAAAGATVSKMSHIMFHSGVLDITYRNTSTYKDSNGVVTLASEAQQEVDIYEIICRRDFSTLGTIYESLGAGIDNEINQEATIGGGGTNIRVFRRGVTPFDCPTALSRLGIKILKKTKYFIPGSSTITYQARDPKRRSALLRELTDEEGANKTGWTRWFLFNIKLVPGLTVGTVNGTYQVNGDVGITRKYFYKIDGIMENRNRYITQAYTAVNPS